KASRGEKGDILDEFCQAIGYNRHYAASILRNWGRPVYWRTASGEQAVVIVGEQRIKKQRQPRPKIYDDRVRDYVVCFWEVMDHPCGKRLKRCLEPMVAKARQFKEKAIPRPIEAKLVRISAPTLDRMLKTERRKHELKCRSKTKPGTLLKKQIAIRSGVEWDEDAVGYEELDLVGHDGGNAGGDYCFTLNVTDIKSGWTEMQAVRNKAQIWVFDALQDIRKRLPFAMKGIDSDNGSEFINSHLLAYCQQEGIVFTRSRSYQKNDNCHVEQKNFTAVRNFVGYNRYDREEELALLNELYGHLRLYLNFFHPQMKLVSKERTGTKVKKRYDVPKTPYQRLLDLEEVDAERKAKLQKTYAQLNPFELKRTIDKLQERLYKMIFEKHKGRPIYAINYTKPVLA
ncbi:MAG: transposase, partial [Candidatus Aminicenantes bacterium]|nr:transposase [Candidatus Aminicenantes bacterium]